MRRALEFVLGRLHERYPAQVARDDFDGPSGECLRLFQRLGFLATEPGMNPVPSCPECFEGTPYVIDSTYFCPVCFQEVDVTELQLWTFQLEPFLAWLAASWGLRGGVEPISPELWRLGTLEGSKEAIECFYARGRALPEPAARRLAAFRSTLLVHGGDVAPRIEGWDGRAVLLTDVLEASQTGLVTLPLVSPQQGGPVRFEEESGRLWAGEVPLGRVPPGTREFHFLRVLAGRIGSVVPYADLKHAVSRASGSTDETEEATFCQKLKSRIKLTYRVTALDRVIRPDPRAGGYVLLADVELPPA